MFRLRFSILLLITTPILASAEIEYTSLNFGAGNAQVQALEASTIPRAILQGPNNVIKWDSFKIGDQTSFVSFLNEGGNITISNRLDLKSPINIQRTDASGSLYIINSNGIVATNGLISGVVSISSPSTLSLAYPINLVSISSVPEASAIEMFALGMVVLGLFTSTFIRLNVKAQNSNTQKRA